MLLFYCSSYTLILTHEINSKYEASWYRKTQKWRYFQFLALLNESSKNNKRINFVLQDKKLNIFYWNWIRAIHLNGNSSSSLVIKIIHLPKFPQSYDKSYEFPRWRVYIVHELDYSALMNCIFINSARTDLFMKHLPSKWGFDKLYHFVRNVVNSKLNMLLMWTHKLNYLDYK